jgi:integrase
LRVYNAWRSEAYQRAAAALGGRLPDVPTGVDQDGALVPTQRPATADSPPYLRIVADLQGAMACGALLSGDLLPTEADLAARYAVAPSTAHRAIAELAAAGVVAVSRGSAGESRLSTDPHPTREDDLA